MRSRDEQKEIRREIEYVTYAKKRKSERDTQIMRWALKVEVVRILIEEVKVSKRDNERG